MNKNKNRNKYRLLKIWFNLYEFLNYLIDYLTTEKNEQKKHIYCIRTDFFKRNSSLSAVGDKYSFTRAHNALASLITSIQSLEPLSYWYNISDNGIDSLCELFRLEDYVF